MREPLLAVALLGALLAGGCGASAAEPQPGGAQRIGLAQPTSRNDDSFGRLSHEGALRAERELGVRVTEVDSLDTPEKQITALENLARTSDLVLMAASVAHQGIYAEHPDTDFAVTAGAMPPAGNTHSTITDWYPAAYLAGVAAAHASDSGVIGFVGGVPVPVVREAAEGYELGARSVDPAIEVLVTNTGSFTDSAKGKGAAAAQIAEGADVVYADLDSAHVGVVQAAAAGDAQVVGSIAPKCDASSGRDLGDTLIRQDEIVYRLIERHLNGDLGAKTTFGLEDGTADFALCPGASREIEAAVERARQAILDGKVELPAPAGS